MSKQNAAMKTRRSIHFGYRARLPIDGLEGDLFVEVILVDDDPAEPFVEIVSAHL
jgi:hypothetical protein